MCIFGQREQKECFKVKYKIKKKNLKNRAAMRMSMK